jgi:serine/threonine protein kinase
LTGRKPFRGETVAQVLDEILHREPKPPRMIDETIPVPLEAIILRCLAKDVTLRYSAAGDLARDLRSRSRSTQAVASMSPERRADLDRFLAETATRKAPSSDFGFSLRDFILDSPRAMAAILMGVIAFGVFVCLVWSGGLNPDGYRKSRNSPRRAAPIHRPPEKKAESKCARVTTTLLDDSLVSVEPDLWRWPETSEAEWARSASVPQQGFQAGKTGI